MRAWICQTYASARLVCECGVREHPDHRDVSQQLSERFPHSNSESVRWKGIELFRDCFSDMRLILRL